MKVAFLLAACIAFAVASKQSVAVEGKLTCHGKPYSGAKVKIYDKDTFTKDDKLAETKSDNSGYFKLAGTGSEVSRLNVKFNIYHRCGKTLPVCYYKASFPIPQSYVATGNFASKLIMHFFLLVLATCLALACASKQSVAVEGKLTCNGKPYAGAKIKLYDHDTFTLDDKLGETKTDNQGYFKVVGTGNEASRLNAKFNIYHRCGKTIPICYYKYSFPVPYDYVAAGTVASRTYNAQTIELSLLEKHRDCFN